MRRFWIFKAMDAKIGSERMKGIDVYHWDMDDGLWGLRERVPNWKYLSRGDYVVFYLGGRGEGNFQGTATLDSGFIRFEEHEMEKRLAHGPFFTSSYGVRLGEIEVWESSKNIRPLLDNLSFITNRENWGSHLRGSITEISESDFEVIVSSYEADRIVSESNSGTPSLTDDTSFSKMRRKVRDNVFAAKVKGNYDFFCALCRKKRHDRFGRPEVESAHIYPRALDGSDDQRNGIALCKLHHWAFENGLFSIRDDYSVVVEERIKGDQNYREIYRFENRTIRLPEEREYAPHPIFLAAHRQIHGFM